MRVLFLHSSFPAQFYRLSQALASDPTNQVVFITSKEEGQLPGVHKFLYKPARTAKAPTHPYVIPFENSVLTGQAVYRVAAELKSQGFVPDIIVGHSGWGTTLFMKDLFPSTPFLCYFEWFSRAHGSVADFDKSESLTPDDECRFRALNATMLTDLYSCDQGLSPTEYQKNQFPEEFRKKITVLHDGVDTDYFKPQLGKKLVLPECQLDLSHTDEVITYVARGMEPTRGFVQFMEAVEILLKRRPNLHVVVLGKDRTAYGPGLSNGQTYKEMVLEKLVLDLSRVHFVGLLPFDQYLAVLQASSAHIYLTRPFVLSWSMMEAMSAGCLVIGSATPPVQEVIEDGVNGLLVDFFSPQEIAARTEEALDNRARMLEIRKRARETIWEKYALRKLLPQQIALLNSMITR